MLSLDSPENPSTTEEKETTKHNFSIPSQGSQGIICYEFGIRLDEACIHLVFEQIRMARRLYNNIVASIRNTHDEMQNFVMDKAGEDARILNNEILDLNEQFKVARADQDEEGMETAALARREKRTNLFSLLKTTRAEIKDEIKTQFYDRIGLRSSCDTYKIRSMAVKSGLGWATANDVLNRALKAYQSRIKIGLPPKFSVGHEKSQDSLRIQFTQSGGCPVEVLFSEGHSGFKLSPPPNAGRRQYGQFVFRMGPAETKAFATGSFYYHRAIPEGSKISSVALIQKRVGNSYKYYLQLVATLPESASKSVQSQPANFCAVHFGWAQNEEGYRNVMALADQADPDTARLFRLPESIQADLARVDTLASERSLLLNNFAVHLKAMTIDFPPELQETANDFEVIKRLPATYISQSRLHRIRHQLMNANIKRPSSLEEWAKKDRSLYQSISFVRRRALFRRRDFYRVISRDIAIRYGTIVIENLTLKEAGTKRDPETGKKSDMNKKSRVGQRHAALHELRSSIVDAVNKEGGVIIELKGAKTVSTCAHCLHEYITVSPADWQLLQCGHCGAETTRKQNGASVAWQFAAPVIDSLSNDARALALQQTQERESSKLTKSTKVAEARAKNRAARAARPDNEKEITDIAIDVV